MSTPRKYKIGDKINQWEIVEIFTDQKSNYLAKCSCGKTLRKNAQALKKNKCCINCRKLFSTKKREPKSYSIGEKINDFEIIGYTHNEKRNLYVCQCLCGNIEKKLSERVAKYKCCRKCRMKSKTDQHIGKIYGNTTVLENIQIGSKTKLRVQCNTCKNEYLTNKNALANKKWCHNCVGGFFPGQVIDNMTLLERQEYGYWKIKCECGEIFKSTLRKWKGKIPSCGCRRKKEIIEKASRKLGLKHKHLKVNKIIGFRDKHLWLEIKCACGKIFQRPNGNEFKSESCGCRWHENAPKGVRCHLSKLTEVEVISLREFFDSNAYSIQELCNIFNLSEEGVKKIIERGSWKHV